MDIKKVGSLHSRGTVFQYYCQGESHSSRLLLRQGNVNKQVADVCNSRKVRVAYNQDPGVFEVNTKTNTLVEYYRQLGPGLANLPEIMSSFLHSHNLIPTWHHANGAWGSFDEDTGRWTGIIGLVSLLQK